MATDELFSGPVSESVPTSVTSFAYATRQRTGSVSSFTYFQEEDDSPDWTEEAVDDGSDDESGDIVINDHGHDLEAGDRASIRRKSSGRTRTTSDQPLLTRNTSMRSDTREHEEGGGNFSQKLYIETEDLTMVIAGFVTSRIGLLAYILICCITGGIGYLALRWVPRWKIRMVGKAAPLSGCTWVVVEVRFQNEQNLQRVSAKDSQNQWGEFTVNYVSAEKYGYPLSSVFGRPSKEKLNGYRGDPDPELDILRFLDYRYMRLIYHPLEDKFMLNNSWWDPQWTDVKALREGLDSDERDPRDQVFGKNVIEIREKTIPELLLDEVSLARCRP
jgi:cation-transporting P-type ATPase 13A2